MQPAPRTVPDVATVAAPKPAPRSHVERVECLGCRRKYRCNVRVGIYTTCPFCGFHNPGEKMRAALARLGVTKVDGRPPKERTSKRRRANGASKPGKSDDARDDSAQGGSAPAAPAKRTPRIGGGAKTMQKPLATRSTDPRLAKDPPAQPPADPPRRGLLDRLLFGGDR
jgi:hypothetical protein